MGEEQNIPSPNEVNEENGEENGLMIQGKNLDLSQGKVYHEVSRPTTRESGIGSSVPETPKSSENELSINGKSLGSSSRPSTRGIYSLRPDTRSSGIGVSPRSSRPGTREKVLPSPRGTGKSVTVSSIVKGSGDISSRPDSVHTPRANLTPRKADKAWYPTRKRITKHLTNAEDVLPHSLDPMYQGMKRTSRPAKHALFANFRAEVNLRKTLDTYNNICREDVSSMAFRQRRLNTAHKKAVQRARSAPIVPRAVEERKYSFAPPARPVSTVTFSSVIDFDSDSDDETSRSKTKKWSQVRKNLPSRPRTAPKPSSTFMTEELELLNPKPRKRPMTAMELIREAEPLTSRIDPEDIDHQRLRTSSYYRRVTSPSLQGVVSTELAAFYRQMRIKV